MIKIIIIRSICQFILFREGLIIDDQDLFRLYCQEIAKYPLLSHKQVIELMQKIKSSGPEGDQARERLISCNLRLVVLIAKKYKKSGLPLLDLVQVGNLGLLRSIETYDPNLGSFSGYAWLWITSKIERYIMSNSLIHVPIYCHKDVELPKILSISGFPQAEGFEGNDYDPPDDRPSPFDNVAENEEHDISKYLNRLNDREKDILTRRINGETLGTISQDYNLSRERIRQVEEKALDRLRSRKNTKGLA